MHFTCAEARKNYGGVAILYNMEQLPSKLIEEVKREEDDESADSEDNDETIICGIGQGTPEDEDLDKEGRVIAKVFADFVLVSVYTPHSGVGDLKRLDYRVERWDRAFEAYIERLKESTGKPIVVCGDLNIIRHDQDIYNAKAKFKEGRPGLTERERTSFE